MANTLLHALANTHDIIHAMGKNLSYSDYRQQYHTDLSPAGWHIGYCSFIESYWLRDRVLGDTTLTHEYEWLYFPENIAKPKRGPALPPRDDHLRWCQSLNAENQAILANPPEAFKQHQLNRDNYLLKFILQHHCQHAETLAMVLMQRQLQLDHSGYDVTQPLVTSSIDEHAHVMLSAKDYLIGNPGSSDAYDNEVPPHAVSLTEIALAETPVSNSQWLAFMEDGGYHEPRWWNEAGWSWRETANVEAPENWRQNNKQQWLDIHHEGGRDLVAEAAVSGINYFEACAFVNWLNTTSGLSARTRLPHEYEWEAADQSGQLAATGQAWEWCDNYFHPYPGFKTFPYDNYSKPWFDQNHYSLRGGSGFTRPYVRRSSFRNFYNPDKRHIFSGLRLAFDDAT